MDREQPGREPDYQSALHQLRIELRQLLCQSSQGAATVELDQPIGRLSRMDALQQQSMTQANRRAADLRLQQIEAALRRLRDGHYGRCLACEEQIDPARLKVRPEAPFCIDCQQSRERS